MTLCHKFEIFANIESDDYRYKFEYEITDETVKIQENHPRSKEKCDPKDL